MNPAAGQVVVQCQRCGHAFTLARRVFLPETLRVVCPRCEAILRVELTFDDIFRMLQQALVPQSFRVRSARSDVYPED